MFNIIRLLTGPRFPGRGEAAVTPMTTNETPPVLAQLFEQPQWQCPFCGKPYWSGAARLGHIKDTHPVEQITDAYMNAVRLAATLAEALAGHLHDPDGRTSADIDAYQEWLDAGGQDFPSGSDR